jgi:hypothetical protein
LGAADPAEGALLGGEGQAPAGGVLPTAAVRDLVLGALGLTERGV